MKIQFELAPSALAALGLEDVDAVTSRLRFLAAAKLYELHRVSVGAAAEIAGLEMGVFLAQFQGLSGSVQ
jgi:hypothetical protein